MSRKTDRQFRHFDHTSTLVPIVRDESLRQNGHLRFCIEGILALTKLPPQYLRLLGAYVKLLNVTTGWLRRHRKLMAWTAGSLTLLLFAIATAGYVTFRHFNDNIAQPDISGMLGHQPADLHPQA